MSFKLPAIPKETKPALLGALVGAGLMAWIGFDLAGWKTSGDFTRLSKRQADSAVVAAQARICSVQFNNAGNRPARFAELEKIERWSRGAVVTKGGFATMLGEKEPNQGVAEACAELLIPEKT